MQSEELLLKICNGDREAFRQLYEFFKDKVYNTSLAYLQNVSDAEETVQDVFVEVYQSATAFKGGSTVTTWIYRITVNKCLDKIRYRSRKKRFSFLSSLFNEQTGALIHDAPTFEHPGVVLENKEQASALFLAIGALPENQKTAFILKQIEGLSQRDIAGVMHLGEKAVESLLQRAKENLRKKLSDIYDRGRRKK